MPLTKSRKLIRFPYNPMLSAKQDTPRPTKRVKRNKEPAHWRTTEGEFVDGTVLHPSSDSDTNETDHAEGDVSYSLPPKTPGGQGGGSGSKNNTSASSHVTDPDVVMLDGSLRSSKAERAWLPSKRIGTMGPLGFLSEPALYQTIDEAVQKTLKRRLVPHLNNVEKMVEQNSADALEKMRERIRVSYQLDYEKLEEQVRRAKE
ncbi:hypothetical protein N0V85_009140, partial [Neurospora sp. IMI 360204]